MSLSGSDSSVSNSPCSATQSNHPHDVPEFDCEPLKIEVSDLSAFGDISKSPSQDTEPLYPIAGSKHASDAHLSAVPAKIPMDTEMEKNLQREHQCRKLPAEGNEVHDQLAEQTWLYEQIAKHQFMHSLPLGMPMWPMLAGTWWPYQDGWSASQPWMCPAPWDGFGMAPPGLPAAPFLMETPFVEMPTESTLQSPCKPDLIGDVATESAGESTDEGCVICSGASDDECSSHDASACSPAASPHTVGLDLTDSLSVGSSDLSSRRTSSSSEWAKEENSDLEQMSRGSGYDQFFIKSEDIMSEQNFDVVRKPITQGGSFAQSQGSAIMPKEALLVPRGAGESVSSESSLSKSPVQRKLPPAPQHPPPTPVGMPRETGRKSGTPPGLTIQSCNDHDVALTLNSQTPVACALEPPPGLPCITAPQQLILGNSARGSNADLPQSSPNATLNCWTHWLVDDSEDQIDSLELSNGDSQSDIPQGMMPPTLVDTLHEKTENDVSEPSDVLFDLSAEESSRDLQNMLHQVGTLDTTLPSTRYERVEQKRELASSACRKPGKLRGKIRVETRPRNKNHATTSTPGPLPPSTAIPHADHSWHRIWFFALAFVVVLLVAMGSFAGQVFHVHGHDESKVTALRVPGTSRAWAATMPHQASSHSRNRKITSVVRSMEIEIARAKAVASHLNSKLGGLKRKPQQTRCQICQR